MSHWEFQILFHPCKVSCWENRNKVFELVIMSPVLRQPNRSVQAILWCLDWPHQIREPSPQRLASKEKDIDTQPAPPRQAMQCQFQASFFASKASKWHCCAVDWWFMRVSVNEKHSQSPPLFQLVKACLVPTEPSAGFHWGQLGVSWLESFH